MKPFIQLHEYENEIAGDVKTQFPPAAAASVWSCKAIYDEYALSVFAGPVNAVPGAVGTVVAATVASADAVATGCAYVALTPNFSVTFDELAALSVVPVALKYAENADSAFGAVPVTFNRINFSNEFEPVLIGFAADEPAVDATSADANAIVGVLSVVVPAGAPFVSDKTSIGAAI